MEENMDQKWTRNGPDMNQNRTKMNQKHGSKLAKNGLKVDQK